MIVLTKSNVLKDLKEFKRIDYRLTRYIFYYLKAVEMIKKTVHSFQKDYETLRTLSFEEAKGFTSDSEHIRDDKRKFYERLHEELRDLYKYNDILASGVKNFRSDLDYIANKEPDLIPSETIPAEQTYRVEQKKYEELIKLVIKKCHEKLDAIQDYVKDMYSLRERLINAAYNFANNRDSFSHFLSVFNEITEKIRTDDAIIEGDCKTIRSYLDNMYDFFKKESKIAKRYLE